MATTLRELAEHLGTTKQTVTTRLKQIGMWDGHVSQREDRAYVVDDDAASAVAAELARNPLRSGKHGNGDDKPDMSQASNDAAIEALRETVQALREALTRASDDHASELARVIADRDRALADRDQMIRSLKTEVGELHEQIEARDAQIEAIMGRSLFDRIRNLLPEKTG